MQKKQQGVITIGLFGTCGNSQWRKPFIEYFEKNNIAFFNPVVPDWDPSCAEIEAEHLVEDEVILFPVTDETSTSALILLEVLAAIGSFVSKAAHTLGATYNTTNLSGFDLIACAIENPVSAKDPSPLAHMKKQQANYPNVYIVDSMEKMLEATKKLHDAMVLMKATRNLTH